jgi:3-hydroxymyristoyl/3-hydroxydecanoyl-(acyl carrier protein) dehydratase
MKRDARGNLRLGSNVVELLLPQRRPFLMVDGIEAFAPGPPPSLEAYRHVTANEGVFDGHLAGIHLWPAAFTIEGLGQTAILLIAILAVIRAAEAEGAERSGIESLQNLERGFRMEPGFKPEDADDFVRRLRRAQSGIAVGTSVDMKFARPVFAGQRLDYRVVLTGEHPGGVRFEAEACVDGSVVAAGVMMGALVQRPILPGA